MTPSLQIAVEGDFDIFPCDFVEEGNAHGMVPKGVMVRHKETGLVAFSFRERSQMKNRDVAISMIYCGLCHKCDHPESKRLSWLPLEWCEVCGSVRHMIAGQWKEWTSPKPF